ncbi:kinesin-like protein KIN-4C [Ziziphus jujuba]|uniref:Kinesin-like protein KIN-4C n=1 Tax=Ziziphus jujuba TaxID=326968 RepID=A0ABM3ILB8_ZIZJJ|nr:kinesin-like protein KIN-4C [Ziziphus jujuba]
MKKTNRRSKQLIDASHADADMKDCSSRVRELEQENKAFQKEIEELKYRLSNVSSTPTYSAEKVKEDYLKKLIVLEDQVEELKRKLDAKSQLSIQRPKGDKATEQLHLEIQSLKAQKVQLQCKVKIDSLQFRLSKASMEKEILQLKKEGRRNQFEMHKLQDSNQRLKMVLQRKTIEAFVATKRLRELLESRKDLLQKTAGARNGNKPATQGMEHELEVTTQIHELCSEYESQMEVMAEEIAKLKEEVDMLKQEQSRCILQEKEADSLGENLDIKELKEHLVCLGSLLGQLRVQKSKLDQGNKSQDVSSKLSFCVTSGNRLIEGANTTESEPSEQSNVVRNKLGSGVCCSCSKKSLCKTTKCRCRHRGGSCGTSCGCAASKCSNREAVLIHLNDSPESQIAESKANSLKIIETEKIATDASQGAMLLQSALVDKPVEKNVNHEPSKKPLSNIGNILANPNGVRPEGRKKRQKPVIQLVTVDAPSSLAENVKATKEAK